MYFRARDTRVFPPRKVSNSVCFPLNLFSPSPCRILVPTFRGFAMQTRFYCYTEDNTFYFFTHLLLYTLLLLSRNIPLIIGVLSLKSHVKVSFAEILQSFMPENIFAHLHIEIPLFAVSKIPCSKLLFFHHFEKIALLPPLMQLRRLMSQTDPNTKSFQNVTGSALVSTFNEPFHSEVLHLFFHCEK